MITKFDERLANIPHDIWVKITKIEANNGIWTGAKTLSPQALGKLKQSVLITSTGASTRIEGSRLSDEDIEKMLRGISIQTFRTRDEQEVRGYYDLLQNVFNAWDSLSFGESLIKHFHKELLKYVEKDITHRGEYKKQENAVHMVNEAGESLGVLFQTTKAYLTPKEMNELVDWTTEAFRKFRYHPLLIIGSFIVEFLSIHPFVDGNGRLSRILTNLLLLQNEYKFVPYVSHEKLIEDNKPEYYLALRKTQKTFGTKEERIDEWLHFFLDILLAQSTTAVDLLSKEQLELVLSPNQLLVWNYLDSKKESSPKELSEKTGVARPTINQVLQKLLSMKKIIRIGQGRTTRYRKIV